MDSLWPIIIVVIISIISSIIKKAKEQQGKPHTPPKTTHFDKHGRPVKTTVHTTPAGGLADILKEFQKLKEAAQNSTQNRPGFPTPAPAVQPKAAFDRFPEPLEAPSELDTEELAEEAEPANGAVSMEDRISVREKALEEYVDEDHPIFKGAGKAGESRISNKPQGKFMSEFGKKENLLRAIIMNEAIFNRKG